MPDNNVIDAKKLLMANFGSTKQFDDTDRNKDGLVNGREYSLKLNEKAPEITPRKLERLEAAAQTYFATGGVISRDEFLNRGEIRVPVAAIERIAEINREFVAPAARDALKRVEQGGKLVGEAIDKAPQKARELDKNNDGVSAKELLDGLKNWWHGKPEGQAR